MSEHHPRIRVYGPADYSVLRDSLNLCFYIRHPHQEIVRGVLHSLETYLNEVGPGALGTYVDHDGYSQLLDDTGWKHIRREMLEDEWPGIQLYDNDSNRESQYGFDYLGKPLGAPDLNNEPNASCMVSFWLPTEYLEEHGPNHVRELALQLAAPLPFCFGQAGLAFKGQRTRIGILEKIRELCFRYPGMDIPEPSWHSWHLGTRVRGPSWLTFLGQPVLGELGGAAGLRSRLSSPGTTVQEMEGERAVVTLGPWPDAGDTEQGRTLPAYRELARVLEPWLYNETRGASPDFTAEDLRRWERRFLD
ncbi:DUF3396 domain-containing protein [Vitiosangium sp. GDMCC 1.1324]|uniref:DUF3396 domain-containing protein n=1 Tax=Vitiosangium sp. (strain GDMCC 1.1324) TaxID=2138576 RepID=UPI000D3AC1D1|nr:DUF3396 domain-containing protein [Vitiosangium sp. GDMCC 1.1324]PTL75040.1 hypothetical protein DAT35_57070 [Vitiosangium sp. GDMCC 1.1324]